MSASQLVTVEIVGVGTGELVSQFITSLEACAWQTAVRTSPADHSRDDFSLDVRLPIEELVDLRALVWDLRYNLPPDCFVHSYTLLPEPPASGHQSLESVVAADIQQQADLRHETQDLIMDL